MAPPAPATPPALSFEVLAPGADDDTRDALRLVADAIAQQRQVASLAVVFHPVCNLAWRRAASSDLGSALIAVCGLVMAYLAAVRLYTAPFLRLAESFRYDSFLAAPRGSRDLILVARFGTDIIATLVLRLPHRPAAHAVTASSSPGHGGGLIRAWTTMLRYRNKGVGADLLRLAITVTRSACGDDAPVVFDPNQAHSSLPLLRTFTRPFTSRDEKAAKELRNALRDCDAGQSRFVPRPAAPDAP